MSRHTKIVATLGPASSTPEVLERMVQAGVDVVRMNFSHGTADDHKARTDGIRAAAAKYGRTVGILGDLQGPKIRVGKLESGRITLAIGDAFILDAGCALGNQERVGLDYKDLPKDVVNGDILLLDDGRLKLEVIGVRGQEIHTRVIVGGELSNNKGINRQGGGLTAPVLIAKIERVEAVTNLDEILDASDGVMVARGDLAVEVGDASVPALQKKMIRLARDKNKLTITATQMMESMIVPPVPTRAEVSDVANAVLDGTDAVMLSAETAAGKYPVEVVESMSRICVEAERSAEITLDREFLDRVFTRIDQSIAMAAIWTAHHLKVKAIAARTQSG